MTKELIIENCQRLAQFYKETFEYTKQIGEPSAKELLKWAGMLLDYMGAPIRNVSRLYLPDEHYVSFIKELEEMPTDKREFIYSTKTGAIITYGGYYWEITNETEKLRIQEETKQKYLHSLNNK